VDARQKQEHCFVGLEHDGRTGTAAGAALKNRSYVLQLIKLGRFDAPSIQAAFECRGTVRGASRRPALGDSTPHEPLHTRLHHRPLRA
jgi:hypothetical protein